MNKEPITLHLETFNNEEYILADECIKAIGIHRKTNTKLHKEIKRLKEEYMILQNASDEVEEAKDREIERLKCIIEKLKERLDFAKKQEEEKLNRIERAMTFNKYILHENWYGGNEKKCAQRNINILLGKETELKEIPRVGSDKE